MNKPRCHYTILASDH